MVDFDVDVVVVVVDTREVEEILRPLPRSHETLHDTTEG